jgi:hypothetical protein
MGAAEQAAPIFLAAGSAGRRARIRSAATGVLGWARLQVPFQGSQNND